MYVYDILAIILIGISHVLLYLQLIQYHRLSFFKIIALSILFTALLSIVVNVTGYPEFNIIMVFLFLISLGLMQNDLPIMRSLYFALASMVSITLLRMVLMELGLYILIQSPFDVYLWSASLIHLITACVIVLFIVLLRKPIQRLAHFIVGSPLYYISYGLLVVGIVVLIILTSPSTYFLATLHEQYGHLSYIIASLLFFILLIMVIIGFHLSKERLISEQQERLDKELLDYVEKLEVLHDELASFRHDYVNVLLSLDEGVRTKNFAQIEKIYREVITPTSNLINNSELDIIKLSYIQVPEVKSVLSVKLIAAQQQEIHVMIDIPQPIEAIAMPLVNFIRIISILVDNAIEEAVNSQEKIIQLAFFEALGSQYFIVRNSSRKETIEMQQIFEKNYSSKKGNRGYGLFSLKKLVDQTANAVLETSFDAPFFTQKLILKK